MIRFSHTIFYVKDVLTTLKFYESAFGLKPRFIHESNTYAELDTGDVALAFASEELGKINLPEGFQKNTLTKPPQGCEIALSTKTPEKYFQQALQAGAQILSPPIEKPWGQVVAYVRDEDGILIEIAGKMV